jgi:ubiquinone/menaquinone biosynthesis C-methylase UbiE
VCPPTAAHHARPAEDDELRSCAFDEMADAYDRTFTDTLVGRALRQIVWSRMDQAFKSSRRILELGCGTGEDAVRMARGGIQVVATDPSPRMLHVARRKACQGDCDQRIEFHCVSMDELGPGLDGELFDGVFSNFGAINCSASLPSLIRDVARRLRPGAPLIWVVMGRHVPWEWFWYLLHGSWTKAWRRLRGGAVEWRGMRISYPTPAEMAELLAPHFVVKRVAALGVALPPSYAADWLHRSPRMLAVLTALEKRAQSSRALASLSDHYIVEAVRSPAESDR